MADENTWQNLNAAPVYDELIDDNKKATHHLRTYLTSLNDSIQSTLVPITYTNAGKASTGMAIQSPNFTTAEINSIQNPKNGMIVYDISLNKFKFYENGTWVTYT